jgi:hypothetical protein
LAPGLQQPVDGGRAHLAELCFRRSIYVLLMVLPEHLYQLWYEGLQSLGTQTVTGLPDLFQRSGNFCAVFTWPTTPLACPGLAWPIQQPYSRLAVQACNLCKFIQYFALIFS